MTATTHHINSKSFHIYRHMTKNLRCINMKRVTILMYNIRNSFYILNCSDFIVCHDYTD